MALQTGDSGCTTGMSLRIYAAIIGGVSTGFSGTLTTDQQNALRALAYGIASGVVAEIQTNGTVSVTADTNTFGAGIPPAPVALSGTIT